MTEANPDGGAVRFLEVLDQLGQPDPRDDIDTASLLRRFPALAEVDVRNVQVEGPHGAVPGRVYRRRGRESAAAGLVWVHGGAFIAGDLDMPESHWVSLEIASRGIPVLALDYRKAVDGLHHPVLSDEVLAGWLAAPKLLGMSADRLHLGGASAGANLSAGVAVRTRAGDGIAPASLLLIYPVLHGELPRAHAAASAAADALPPELRFTPGFVRAINLNYVGDPAGLTDPVAFAGHADAAGLPPTLIVNAEGDDLRASGEAFEAQLRAAGVAVSGGFEPGTVHGYLDQPGLPAAISTIEKMLDWITHGPPRAPVTD